MPQSRINTSPSVVVGESDILPVYVQVQRKWRVALCTTHGSCYTRQNLARHLLKKHRIPSNQRRSIESNTEMHNVAATNSDAVQPPDRTEEIHGLPTVLRYLYHF
jgi:hypothetical protein